MPGFLRWCSLSSLMGKAFGWLVLLEHSIPAHDVLLVKQRELQQDEPPIFQNRVIKIELSPH